MEQLKYALGVLTDIDDDFYAMGVILADLEKIYPIERNPEAFSVVHMFRDWILNKKRQLELTIEKLDDGLAGK